MDNGVASPELPEWLPDGWIMKTVSRKDGIVDLSYVSPVSRRTFRSRDEVLHYLNFESSDAIEAVKTICEEAKRSDVVGNQISPIWLPSGWILEIKTRKSGAKAGKKYKCYFDPFTGCRHYSKAEVFRHLNGEESCKFTTKKKKPPGVKPEEKHLCKFASDQKSISVDFRDDLQAIVENYPDGLPSSCIEEVKYRGNASKLGKDPPPISAKKLNEGSRERRCLFSGQAQKPRGRTEEEDDVLIIESLPTPPPAEAAPRKGRGSKKSHEDDPGGELAHRTRCGAESEQLAVVTRRTSKRLAGLEPSLFTLPAEATPRKGQGSKRSHEDNTDGELAHRSTSGAESEQLALATRRASKRLAGLEPSLPTRPPEAAPRKGRESKRSREDDPDGELAQCSSRSGAKSGELALMMRRASKRLAGLEPDHVLSTEDIDRTLKRGRRSAQSRSSIVPTPFIDICDLEADSPEVNHGSLGKQFGSVEKAGAADTVAESAVTPPFNDYMLDQCIEFSIKKSLLPAQDANGRVKMLCKRTSTRNVPSFGE